MQFNLTVGYILTMLFWTRTLCIPDVELEVTLLVDGVILLGVSVLPAGVGINVITWVVSVGPSTVYMQSTSNFTFTYIHYMLFTLKSDPTYIHMLTVCTYCICLYVCAYSTYAEYS